VKVKGYSIQSIRVNVARIPPATSLAPTIGMYHSAPSRSREEGFWRGETPELAMGKVFALTAQDLLSSLPLYGNTTSAAGWMNGATMVSGIHSGPSRRTTVFTAGTRQTRCCNSGVGHNAPGVIPLNQRTRRSRTTAGKSVELWCGGTDTFEVTIDESGNVTGPALITPIGLGVDDSAVETITRKWKFDPGQSNGKHVPTNMTLEVEYRRQK
jgi:hypothetical protein